MHIPEDTKQGLYKYLGDKTDEFLSQAGLRIEKYTRKWQLTDISFMPTDTVNLLFSCESALYGSCVLKVCIPSAEVATEANCLLAYDGKGYCKLWAHDLSDDILLLQREIPGDQIWAVPDYKERARLMALTVKDLHIPWDGQKQYPSYRSWLEGIHCTLSEMDKRMGNAGAVRNMESLLFYLNEAIKIYTELKQRHPQVCLLHGDLHQENMLLNSQGGYTIIDPKGVVDAPAMETARFLMNEVPDPLTADGANRIREMAAIMSSIIGISKCDLLKSMFVDAALMNSWTMEAHFPTQEAFEKEKQSGIKRCKFVYELMNP